MAAGSQLDERMNGGSGSRSLGFGRSAQPGAHATIDPEDFAGDERRLVGGEEQHGARNLGRVGHAAERMHGVWYVGVEESGFVPDANNVPLIRDIEGRNPEMETFLDATDVAFDVKRLTGQSDRERCTRAFRLEFIGRRSAGMGLKEDEISIVKQVIVVDRLLSAMYLGKVRTRGVPGYDSECAEAGQAIK